MDPVTVVYYSAVCCALGGLSPRIAGRMRYVVGAIVGALSALMLPQVRALTGL